MNSFPVSVIITIAALVLVLVLAWLLIRALSSMTVSRSRGGRLEILETVPLGSRERLVLVRCDGQQFLLGVTANSISRIDQIDSPETNPS